MKPYHVAAFLTLALLFINTANAQTVTVDTDCSTYQEGGTIQMNECRSKQYDIWNQTLNNEYKAALKRVNPSQKVSLRNAQRLWVQYRNANCETYAQTDGTIGSMMGGSCFLDMTKQRALELKTLGDLTG